MAATVGWILNEAGITFPGMLSNNPPLAFSEIGAGLAAWEKVPELGKWQIFGAIAVAEILNEMRKPVSLACHQAECPVCQIVMWLGVSHRVCTVWQHYMTAGMPKANSPKALSELKNGRLAMIGVASFYAAELVPGSVPGLPAAWH